MGPSLDSSKEGAASLEQNDLITGLRVRVLSTDTLESNSHALEADKNDRPPREPPNSTAGLCSSERHATQLNNTNKAAARHVDTWPSQMVSLSTDRGQDVCSEAPSGSSQPSPNSKYDSRHKHRAVAARRRLFGLEQGFCSAHGLCATSLSRYPQSAYQKSQLVLRYQPKVSWIHNVHLSETPAPFNGIQLCLLHVLSAQGSC